MEIEKLGLKKEILNTLKNLGIKDTNDLIYIGDKVLSDILGISREKALELIRECYKYYEIELKPVTEMKESIDILESPLEAYNRFFSGFRSRRIFELYGKFGSGKTNFLMTIAVDSLIKGHKVIWFDTEGTLSLDRVEEIFVKRCGLKGIEPNLDLLKNFYVKRVGHSDEIVFASIRLGKLVESTGARVIIFDSLTAPFRSDYAGIGELAERQIVLGYVMRSLLRMAELLNLWIFFSNQVVSVVSPTGQVSHEAVSPIGGNVLQHLASEIYYLKKKGNERYFCVKDVPDLPELEIPFKITEAGVVEK
jgi:DNA repair protein RAD51